MFKNVPDPKAKRGAIQKSMLILSRYPFFDLFEPILREAIGKYIVSASLSFLNFSLQSSLLFFLDLVREYQQIELN
jgi:hypothetical protein